jgi:hypothetical protein
MTKRTVVSVASVVAVAAIALAARRYGASVLNLAPSQRQLAALIEERRELRDRLRRVLERDNVLDFASAPPGNVLVGVPTTFTESLVDQMVSDFLSTVRLRLDNLTVHHEDEVKARVLFGRRTVGRFTLDVNIKLLRAVLKPGKPKLDFGGDTIKLELPVSVVEGKAEGTVHFKWDGQGIAGLFCGDVDVNPGVSSRVKPATYDVKGNFLLKAEKDVVVAEPRFDDLAIRVQLDPPPETWKTIATVVEQVKDDKSGVCANAIRKIDVPALIKRLIDKGFMVKIPSKLFRVSLPASVDQAVEIEGRTLRLGAQTTGFRVTPQMLWYGAEFGAARPTPVPVAPAPSP